MEPADYFQTVNPSRLRMSSSNNSNNNDDDKKNPFSPPQSLPGSSIASPRGVKRVRSGDKDAADAGASFEQPRKKATKVKSETFASPPTGKMSIQTVTSPPSTRQTPQPKSTVPESPSHASPSRSTPSTNKVVKTLPTLRDHTTTDLNADEDEYIPREIDEEGEKKISAMGAPLGGRRFTVETFTLVTRGAKLYMLATRCAQSLAYRDSYLLFHKNKSLYKIVANGPEKDEMIRKNIIPNAYRSRQIAIVTAKSMFRQFGSRLVKDGRKVKDDYFEAKARKQGFTEDDPAWAKRPGEVKHKEPAPSNDISSIGANAMNQLGRGQVIYQDDGYSQAAGPQITDPISQMFNFDADEMQMRDYGDAQRPRQDVSGIPYTDRTSVNTDVEIVNQAAQATQFNGQIRQQSSARCDYLTDFWQKPHPPAEPPSAELQAAGGAQIDQQYTSSHATRSTPAVSIQHPLQQPAMQSHISNPSLQNNNFARPLNPSIHSPSPNMQGQGMSSSMLSAQLSRPQPFNYNAPQQTPSIYNSTPNPNPAATLWPTPHSQLQASPMQPPPSQTPYQPQPQSHPTGPSPSPHPLHQPLHHHSTPHTVHPSMNQTLAQSHGIGLGSGYQSSGHSGGGIPGMQTPMGQGYLQQQQQQQQQQRGVGGFGGATPGQGVGRPGTGTGAGGFGMGGMQQGYGQGQGGQQQQQQQQQGGGGGGAMSLGMGMGLGGGMQGVGMGQQGWNGQMMGGAGGQGQGQGQGAQGGQGQGQQQQGGWGGGYQG